jgi:hypothetical protein
MKEGRPMATESMSSFSISPPRPNPYGVLAWEHMARYLPDRFTQIPDPAAYFADLGEQIAAEIEETQAALAGSSTPEEDYFAKVGRMRMAQLMAEEKVLAEQVFLTPTQDPDDSPRDETGAFIGPATATGTWTPLWDGGDPDTQE